MFVLLVLLFGVRTAAREFFHGEISEWTIRSWIRTGKLPAQKAGSRVLIAREDLERFLKPHPVTSGAAREARAQ